MSDQSNYTNVLLITSRGEIYTAEQATEESARVTAAIEKIQIALGETARCIVDSLDSWYKNLAPEVKAYIDGLAEAKRTDTL